MGNLDKRIDDILNRYHASWDEKHAHAAIKALITEATLDSYQEGIDDTHKIYAKVMGERLTPAHTLKDPEYKPDDYETEYKGA